MLPTYSTPGPSMLPTYSTPSPACCQPTALQGQECCRSATYRARSAVGWQPTALLALYLADLQHS